MLKGVYGLRIIAFGIRVNVEQVCWLKLTSSAKQTSANRAKGQRDSKDDTAHASTQYRSLFSTVKVNTRMIV